MTKDEMRAAIKAVKVADHSVPYAYTSAVFLAGMRAVLATIENERLIDPHDRQEKAYEQALDHVSAALNRTIDSLEEQCR